METITIPPDRSNVDFKTVRMITRTAAQRSIPDNPLWPGLSKSGTSAPSPRAKATPKDFPAGKIAEDTKGGRKKLRSKTAMTFLSAPDLNKPGPDRGEGLKTQAATVEEWLSLNEENMITCPYHSGDLKITRSSCRKRRRKAIEWNYGAAADNLFLYGCEQNLRVCLECDRIPLNRAEPSLGMDVLNWGWKSRAALTKGRGRKEKKDEKKGDRPSDFSPAGLGRMKGQTKNDEWSLLNNDRFLKMARSRPNGPRT